jgi:hypothetical protein
MISEAALTQAIERGVISAEQADALRALAKEGADAQEASPPPPPPPPPVFPEPPKATGAKPPPLPLDVTVDRQDDEALRFVTSFADIFVSLGIALFFSSAAFLIGRQIGATGMWATLAVLAWIAAELFSRRLRLALPSIILLGLFSGSVFMATMKFTGELDPTAPLHWWHPTDHFGWFIVNATGIAVAGITTAALTSLHYLRFRVPITIAAMAAALIATLVGVVFWLAPDTATRLFNWLLLAAGIIIFFAAMRFDMSDLQRQTRRTDIAFWLHLLAAPLIVHPLLAMVSRHPLDPAMGLAPLDTHAAAVVLAIFFGLGLVSLVIDRRALLVSGLAYAGVAFGTLLSNNGFTSNTPAETLLALGFFILFLSALWRPLRRGLLRLLPQALVMRLPHSHVPIS